MNRITLASVLLVATVATAPALVTAAHHGTTEHSASDEREQHHKKDPEKRAQKLLDKLEQKLNLTDDQQAAWNTYSQAVMARAAERARHMGKHHASGGDHHKDMDTASLMEHKAERMRERADKMQQMAQDTRAFQQALSTDQQAIFDKYWKSKLGKGKKRRRHMN